MATVEYRQATCTYPGMSVPAVDALDLHIEDGEFMVLVGPSGSGKSTALRMLAGLEMVSSGEVLIGGKVVTGAPPKARDIAMVFQSYALYPHLTVRDNLAFPLKQKRVPHEERTRLVEEAARILEIEALLDRRPRQLSGGQRQRVAMGRAIVRQPQAFLMDEPLSNLDAKLRVQTRAEISALQHRLGITTVYVTHDQIEAMTLGHRVAVLRDGKLQQCDTPRTLYEHPDNVFVAGFVGSPAMNLDRLPFDGTAVRFGEVAIPLPGPAAAAARGAGLSEVVFGIRPDALHPLPAPSANGTPRLSCRVHLVEDTGADAWVHLDIPDGAAALRLVARADARSLPAVGDTIPVAVRVAEAHVFDPSSGQRLGD
ncbi:MAG TPA: ATP-binding cassette domain-containing protein [Candidatus Binatia bacterium]|nr:ATP-binding cassette domain-containing protein [Candidatus Binatia bacterium]